MGQSCAIFVQATGEVYSWGSGRSGALGHPAPSEEQGSVGGDVAWALGVAAAALPPADEVLTMGAVLPCCAERTVKSVVGCRPSLGIPCGYKTGWSEAE